MRLLIDMNLTPRWVPFLSEAGHEAVHWSAVGPPDATDRSICEYALAHRFVVVTNDLDFPQILAHTKESRPSIILLRGEPLVPEVRCGALLLVLQNRDAELLAGAILSLDLSGKTRSRLLPL